MVVIAQQSVSVYEDPDGKRIQRAFTNFLNGFMNENGQVAYEKGLLALQEAERNTITINYPDITKFSGMLSYAIETQFYRFQPFLIEAVRLLAAEKCGEDETIRKQLERKEVYVSFLNLPAKRPLRELTMDKIGGLIRISGQVVRTHPVHPELYRATFICEDCGTSIRNVQQQFKYTLPTKCDNPRCPNRTKFLLDVNDSTFVDYQRVRIQESQEEIPLGCIPRTVDIIVRGECVESAQPGDHCDFVGTLIAIPDVSVLSAPGIRADIQNRKGPAAGVEGIRGLKSLGVRDLNYKLAFLTTSITPSNFSFGGIEFTHDEMDHERLWASTKDSDRILLRKMSEDPNIVKNLCDSLFPDIYGNDDVKLGILLMLFGGVEKNTAGSHLRGDINVCLVGDPSCAKSQFLKTVNKFSARVVYTSGKASTAAGLTAAVVKDEESFDFVIEAGALMLADNGICCIDEFDKMDPKDQVAIHEAMEQQTISITKAGVKATLNARCSILAAANPIGGRYDKSKPLSYNVQLSAPILSRFDLFFVMTDEINPVVDYAVARRVLDNHEVWFKPESETNKQVYKVEEIRCYIMFARCFKPKISKEAAEELKKNYKQLRLDSNTGSNPMSRRITVRQLESLIRLSEALARLHCAPEVQRNHVEEAVKLVRDCNKPVVKPDVELNDDFNSDSFAIPDADNSENVLRDISNTSEEVAVQRQSEEPEAENVDPEKLKISFEFYKRVSNMLVLFLRSEQDAHAEDTEWAGIKCSALSEWYLEMVETELNTEEEYNNQKLIIKRLIKKLIKDNVLISLDNRDAQDPVVVVHPDHIVEEYIDAE